MYKAVFQNSKIALIFAVMTIMGAVSMVGTSEDSGLLLRVVTLVSNSRSHDAAAEVQAAPPPAKPKPVFGDYAPQQGPAVPEPATMPGAVPASERNMPAPPPAPASEPGNPMTAPLSPTAFVPTE